MSIGHTRNDFEAPGTENIVPSSAQAKLAVAPEDDFSQPERRRDPRPADDPIGYAVAHRLKAMELLQHLNEQKAILDVPLSDAHIALSLKPVFPLQYTGVEGFGRNQIRQIRRPVLDPNVVTRVDRYPVGDGIETVGPSEMTVRAPEITRRMIARAIQTHLWLLRLEEEGGQIGSLENSGPQTPAQIYQNTTGEYPHEGAKFTDREALILSLITSHETFTELRDELSPKRLGSAKTGPSAISIKCTYYGLFKHYGLEDISKSKFAYTKLAIAAVAAGDAPIDHIEAGRTKVLSAAERQAFVYVYGETEDDTQRRDVSVSQWNTIYRKLGVRYRHQAVMFALRDGIMPQQQQPS